VGIGACTAMFSIIHAVLLRPMAVPNAARVVMLWSKDVRHDAVGEATYEAAADYRARLRSFDDIALMSSVNWSGALIVPGRESVRLAAAVVSGTFFELLGSRPLLGRVFDATDDDPGADRRLVLSHAAWVQLFGADPAVVGRRVTLREEAAPQPFEVIGVMRPEFFFPRGAQYWTTAAPRLEAIARHTGEPRQDLFGKLGVFYALGRLKPGVSVDDARREMPLFVKAVADQYRVDLSSLRIVVTPLFDFIFGPARQTLWLLMAAVVLVLLIACGNVAGLVFARGASRRRELAVRAALGASRGTLVRQLLAESAVIAGAGSLLGVAAAAAVLETLVALSPADIPRLDAAGIDLPVVAFALAAALVATALVGLVPALRASRTSLVDDMKNGTMGAGQANSGRGLLVAVQVAGTLVLLLATGLCLRSFARLTALDLGFDPSQVLTFQVTGLDEEQFPARAARHEVVERLLANLERLPQVRAAGAVYERPFEHGPIGMDSAVLLEGQADTPEEISRNGALNWESVTSRYFESMSIRLLRGRTFDERDGPGAALSAIVSEAAANRLWPGQDPIGRRVRLSLSDDGRWHTVVGVVATARYREIVNPRLDFYVPMRQSPIDVKHFTVRTNGDPLAATAAVASAVGHVDPRLSIGGVTTMDTIVRRVRGPWHFTLIVFALFGLIALALAVVGLFAVVSYAVARRSREIGVRIALGATPARVVRLMLAQGAGPAAAGLLAGAIASRALAGAVQPLLFDVSAGDLRTFGSVVLFFALVIFAATYVPARRAGRVDPQAALRHE
jgi:predicted permease